MHGNSQAFIQLRCQQNVSVQGAEQKRATTLLCRNCVRQRQSPIPTNLRRFVSGPIKQFIIKQLRHC